MIKEQAFLAIPSEYKKGIRVYPPKIHDIVSNRFFPTYRHILTVSQEELEDEYTEKNISQKIPTPLEFILINSYHDKAFEKMVKDAFYFFLKEQITISYEQKMILVGNIKEMLAKATSLEDIPYLNEQNFFDFQNEIRASLGEKPIEPPNPDEHPKIKRMKALARLRDRVKAKQGSGINLITTLASICCMGIGITPLNIGEMSYAAIGLLMQTYQEKEKYAIDIASLQAGADSKKINPKYWIRNLE